MDQFCKNHPQIKAISFCHNCKAYYCSRCLSEGKEFYYCSNDECNKKLLEEDLSELSHNMDQSFFYSWYSYLSYLFGIGMIYQFIQINISSLNIDLLMFVASSIGSAMGLGLISFVIALIRKLKKKGHTRETFRTYYIISTILFALLLSNILIK